MPPETSSPYVLHGQDAETAADHGQGFRRPPQAIYQSESALVRAEQRRIARFALLCGGILALVAVMAGAFGAHALRDRLTADMLAVFETGARYQMYHGLALIGLGCAAGSGLLNASTARAAAWLFLIGTLIFSGTLYALTLSGVRILGAITPIGGVLMMIGWAAFLVGVWRQRAS